MANKTNVTFETEPCLQDLSFRGFIEGTTYLNPGSRRPQCHFFGGIPYALPPLGPYRWTLPRPLPACYRYGTRANPGRFTGGAALCPQRAYRDPSNEKLWDEDCLQLNVWVPAGEKPARGWPVFFFIHGGWLQFGSPNSTNARAMLAETPNQCIVICPAYRLNVFGFLASRELQEEAASSKKSQQGAVPVGNYGFWDQRLALEWTYKNISYFGGDAANITLAGFSAGAHSVFHQLSHDIFLPVGRRIVKRAILWSNGSGMQPKSLTEIQDQFDSLLSALSIPLSLSSTEKLSRLRSTPAKNLLSAIETLDLHEFRAVTDGAFVRHDLFKDIESGEYGRQLRDAGVHLLMGECKDENFVYGSWRSGKIDSLQTLRTRLCADYPAAAVDAVLSKCYCPDDRLPPASWKSCADWAQAFGHIYADLQVHALERGFADRLAKGGAADLVHRYRVEWRAKCVDVMYPHEWGVTHGTDLAIWFWGMGMGDGLQEEEKETAQRFWAPFVRFVQGHADIRWEAQAPYDVRKLKADGQVEVWRDWDWDRALKVWNTVIDALNITQDHSPIPRL